MAATTSPEASRIAHPRIKGEISIKYETDLSAATGLGSGIRSKIAVVTLGKASWIVVVALCVVGAVLLALTGYSGYSIVAGAVGISAAINLT